MNMHSTPSCLSTEAVAALAPDAEPQTLDPDALAFTLHELRDLLAPVVQCATILRMSSTRSARVERTSEVLARNVRAVQRLLDELDAGHLPGQDLRRT